MPGAQWARLREDVDCGLRRGAWYSVVSVSESEIVLAVRGKNRPYPLRSFEVVTVPPNRWTIVSHAGNSPLIPARWAKGYVVCPNCRWRQLLLGRPQVLRCEGCDGLFEIAWDEPYLDPAEGNGT